MKKHFFKQNLKKNIKKNVKMLFGVKISNLVLLIGIKT